MDKQVIITVLGAVASNQMGITAFVTKMYRRLEELAYSEQIIQAMTGSNIAARFTVSNEEYFL